MERGRKVERRERVKRWTQWRKSGINEQTYRETRSNRPAAEQKKRMCEQTYLAEEQRTKTGEQERTKTEARGSGISQGGEEATGVCIKYIK